MDTIFDFRGKTAVVAGGASGLGQGIADRLLEAGARVYICDLNQERAKKVAWDWCEKGADARAVYIDGTNPSSLQEAADLIMQESGRIHYLVNTMGIGAKAREGEAWADTFRRVVGINMMGIFNSCTVFGEEMIKTGGGSIVNIASQAATIVPAKTRPGRGGEYGLIGYCTSKAGVKHMTRAMATLWAQSGIRANSVSPGYVDTPLTAEPHSDPQIRASMIAGIPLRRIAQPYDIAGLVLFLLSDASSYLIAQDVIIDGGYTAQ